MSWTGLVAVKLGDGSHPMPVLTAAELASIGVARVSIGPGLFHVARNAVKDAAARILAGGGLVG